MTHTRGDRGPNQRTHSPYWPPAAPARRRRRAPGPSRRAVVRPSAGALAHRGGVAPPTAHPPVRQSESESAMMTVDELKNLAHASFRLIEAGDRQLADQII